jgi:glutamate formiminotransferase / 5-formyltetrahydrofolate cyclo-ligase
MRSRALLAVPNFSEGRDAETIAALSQAIELRGDRARGKPDSDASPASPAHTKLLNVHSDADHGRSVFSVAGGPRALSEATVRAGAVALARIDLARPERHGQHPHVGVLDVAPIVYVDQADRGAACAEALLLADRLGDELRVPVFLYGELTATAGHPVRTRAELRRGGLAGLIARVSGATEEDHRVSPDFGPRDIDPHVGVTLVAARPPLVAFNLELAPPARIEDARRIAALIREGGEEGLPGLRAIGIELTGSRPQVSMNVERPLEVSLAEVVAAVGRHAKLVQAELVGLAPAAALEGFPPDLPMPGFDPVRQVIENAIGS